MASVAMKARRRPSGETATELSVDFSGGRTETRVTGVSTGARRRDEMTNGSAARSAMNRTPATIQGRCLVIRDRLERIVSVAIVSVWPELVGVPAILSIAKARSLAE